MRTFKVMRREDVSGVSGVGHVADAVEFDDGAFVLRWRAADKRSTAFYESRATALAIHGHDGRTEFVEE